LVLISSLSRGTAKGFTESGDGVIGNASYFSSLSQFFISYFDGFFETFSTDFTLAIFSLDLFSSCSYLISSTFFILVLMASPSMWRSPLVTY